MPRFTVKTCGLVAIVALFLPVCGCGSQPPTSTSATGAEERPTAASDVARPAASDDTTSLVAAKPFAATFDDIKFDIEPGAPFRREMLSSQIEALADRRMRIRGYILPTAQSRGIKQFVLVRDNQQCCFGPGAALYDCILVEMQPGKTAEFSVRPVAVEGVFRIELITGLDEKPLAIYRLDADSVEH